MNILTEGKASIYHYEFRDDISMRDVRESLLLARVLCVVN